MQNSKKTSMLLHSTSDNHGVSMVEVAITAPVFLLIVFIAIWWGITSNQKATFQYALGTAPRLAITRGSEAAVGAQLIPEVNSWIAEGSGGTPASDLLRGLLATPAEEGVAFGGGGWYLTQWNQTLEVGGSITRIPPSYVYSMIYFYQTLKQGVGGALRFPCDPTDPINGSGCARCTNLNATTRTRSASTGTQAKLGELMYNYNFVGLYCEYRPDDVITTPIVRLISTLGLGGYAGTIVFTGDRHFEVVSRLSNFANPASL